MTWFDLIWFDLIWFDMIWFDLIWFDLIWYVMSCHVMSCHVMSCHVMSYVKRVEHVPVVLSPGQTDSSRCELANWTRMQRMAKRTHKSMRADASLQTELECEGWPNGLTSRCKPTKVCKQNQNLRTDMRRMKWLRKSVRNSTQIARGRKF